MQLAGLRSALSSQLAEPMGFGLANPITGHSLGSLVPAMVSPSPKASGVFFVSALRLTRLVFRPIVAEVASSGFGAAGFWRRRVHAHSRTVIAFAVQLFSSSSVTPQLSRMCRNEGLVYPIMGPGRGAACEAEGSRSTQIETSPFCCCIALAVILRLLL